MNKVKESVQIQGAKTVKNEGVQTESFPVIQLNESEVSFKRTLERRKGKVKDKKRNTTQQAQSNSKVINDSILNEFQKLSSAYTFLKKYSGYKNIIGQTFRPSIAYANMDLNAILYSFKNEERVQLREVQKSLNIFDTKDNTELDVIKGQAIYNLLDKYATLSVGGQLTANLMTEIVMQIIEIVGLPRVLKGAKKGEINLTDTSVLFIHSFNPSYILDDKKLKEQFEAIQIEQANKEAEKKAFKIWKATQK